MNRRLLSIFAIVATSVFPLSLAARAEESEDKKPSKPPAKVYVPYKELKGVFETEGQGIFLPYTEFQRLWRAAQGKPDAVAEAPFKYLISTARFHGDVTGQIATLHLELTIDILGDGWVQVPLGLGEVAVSSAAIVESENAKIVPLLRVVDGEYVLVTKGKGRCVLSLDFVRQLETQPGLAVLKCRVPPAAITTLELLIPEENLKVDVEPMLAATTSQVDANDVKATRLQAFLGSARDIQLSWKPKTQAAAELEPVMICEQFQHVNIAEALINYDVTLNYEIHRGGVDSFAVQLPGEFRVTNVTGANIAKWDIETSDEASGKQKLVVKLFSPAEDKYTLTVKMERFLQEAQARIQLVPIVTEKVLRRSGLIGITYSPRRSVQLEAVRNLARIDTGQLPSPLQEQPRVTAYRFITSDYGGTLAIGTTSPRITVDQRWMLGVESDRLQLRGRIRYKVERTGIFELNMDFPPPWEVERIGPETLVDDYQLTGPAPGVEGDIRKLHVLLKREKIGEFELEVTARAERSQAEGVVDFNLPLPDAKDLQSCQGQLVLLLADQLRAEVQSQNASGNQLQAIPLQQAEQWTTIPGLSPAMAFEFRAIDPNESQGVTFKIAIKPSQVSAIVHRLVNVQPGSVEQEAVIQYRIRYAPLDTFYVKMPKSLADSEVQITGANIKEKPRLNELPPDQRVEPADPNSAVENWAYYKIVLQSRVTGAYDLRVRWREPFQMQQGAQATTLKVEPVLAAGKLSDQNGHVAIAKADTLAIGEPVFKNLIPADAGSAADLPYQAHRRIAVLAFKYNAPPFELSLPVIVQTEREVFTTIVNGVMIEQVLARDGLLNTHATYALVTSRGDRLPVALPAGAELTAVLLNGNEAPVEAGASRDELIVRLPPSAGQVSTFVLEVSYGLKEVSASNLAAPALPEAVPVQQTLWRLWIPDDYDLLWHNRLFSRLSSSQAHTFLQGLNEGRSGRVTFKLAGQGKNFDFIRQGAPGTLLAVAAPREVVSIIVWTPIILLGLLMLKLSGFQRVLVILAGAVAGGAAHLYSPLLVDRILYIGAYPAVLVLVLWFAQWTYFRLPKLCRTWASKPRRTLQEKREAQASEQDKPSELEKE
jgi:hypothetical protein